MQIIIYNTESDENHLYKDISNVVGDFTGKIRGEISVHRPDILIADTITTGNYAYIPEFARYYWIREKTVLRENVTLLQLESDPLFSFAADILNMPGYVFRANVNYNMDMTDSKTPRVVYDRVQVLAPQGIGGIPQFNASDSNVYLQCIGGE